MPRKLTPAQLKLLRYFYDLPDRAEFHYLNGFHSRGLSPHADRTAASLVPAYLECERRKTGRMKSNGEPWRDVFTPVYRLTDEGVAYVETHRKA